MVRSFNPPQLWSPFGKFSMIALQGAGQVVHLKGQVSLNETGEIVGKGDMRAQVRRTLTNLRAALSSVGGTMADVISLTHYTTNIDDFIEAGDVRGEFFDPPYPVTTTVQVVRLFHPDLLIEITGIAEISHERFMMPE